jgi:uncharacterized protein (TIGR00730 family)
MSDNKRVLVFCGSREGNDNYVDEMKQIAATLASYDNISLVYGGGSCGLMKVVADAFFDKNRLIKAIYTKQLADQRPELLDSRPMMVSLVDTMEERKREMIDSSDIVILAAGGIGSIEEFMFVLSEKQLGIHKKPVIIVNTQGLWDNLINQMKKIDEEGFGYNKFDTLVTIYESAHHFSQSFSL